MKIPKYITHPLLIVTLSSGLLYLLWQNSPSASQIQQASQTQNQTQPAQPVQYLDKNALLRDNQYYQIEDMENDGRLIIPELSSSWTINDARFKNLKKDKVEKLRGFFAGKFIKITDTTVASKTINLPVEIYSPLCFSNDPNQRAQTNECPLLLQP